MIDINNFDAIKIGLASSKQIRSWSSGEVIKPETINDDPYGEGWLVKVKLSDPSELDALISAAERGAARFRAAHFES